LKTTSSQRKRRWGALLLLAALPAIAAHARTHHSEAWARERFAAAERMREALNGRPSADRSRRDYQRVLNAYRNVYYGAPTSTKADPSVVAVAETLVEMGRRFEDDKILHEAIAQYKFLRREYPGSKYRCDALFTIGEVYSDDLNDPDQARAAFREFLRRYPHNRLADDARKAIADLDHQAAADKKSELAQAKEAENAPETGANESAPVSAGSTQDRDSKAEDSTRAGTPAPQLLGPQLSAPQSGRLPRVTGIRHWSTPDYTRVAIDLESDIKYFSQRISHPDRIYFDLRDTKLASTLVGKSFDVDDGFLKKIRVAQFQPGRTRVVLEVDSLSDYDAFLLPDPYRLIIDIHGKDIHGKAGRRRGALKAAKAATPKDANETASRATERTLADSSAPEKGEDKAEAEHIADSKTGGVKATSLAAGSGNAPVTSEDVADNARISPKNAPSDSPRSPEAEESGSARRETPVTKVVVEADDDDTPLVSHHRRTTRSRSRTHGRKSEPDSAEANVREASPTSNGDRSLIRALGLKIGKIVIDPGHGGHDTGTIGPNGLEEKDLVLEVGRRLGKLLETRLGAEVVYTRKDDTFIPLETRTAIANQQRADLFISIHANSSHDPAARGVETYYLNFTSSPDALEVAARENAVSEKSIYELQDLVKKIALKEKIEESREFAADVEESLYGGLAAKNPGIRNRGVKKAPFIVLIGANMPSILAEISFVSNPGDERRLETSEYRQRIAESLYKGIAKYVNGLSGVKVASKIEKVSAQ
jgi:N-acetylmuramoyl-L-alanine amidase